MLGLWFPSINRGPCLWHPLVHPWATRTSRSNWRKSTPRAVLIFSTSHITLQVLLLVKSRFFNLEWSGKSPKMLFSMRKGWQRPRWLDKFQTSKVWEIGVSYIIYYLFHIQCILCAVFIFMYCHVAYTSQWPNEKDTISPSLSAFFSPRTLPWCRNHQLCHWQLISSADVQLRSLSFQNLHQLKFVVWVRPRKKPSPQSWLAAAWPSLP